MRRAGRCSGGARDEDFLARSYALNLSGLQQLTQAFEALGLEYVPATATSCW